MTSHPRLAAPGRHPRQGDVELIDEWRATPTTSSGSTSRSRRRKIIEPLLEERFGFHELAAEDTLSPNTLPKYDSFSTLRLLRLPHRRRQRSTSTQSETFKIAAFLGKNFLFTMHRQPLAAVDDVCDRAARATGGCMERGPDFLLYSIVDQLVDAHFPLLEQIEERVDEIQDRIFDKSAAGATSTSCCISSATSTSCAATRCRSASCSTRSRRGDAHFIQREHLIYFRDVYDHMFRISETIDVDRDLMTGTMDAYLSVVANRTNEIMKVLTIFSAIMLPHHAHRRHLRHELRAHAGAEVAAATGSPSSHGAIAV